MPHATPTTSPDWFRLFGESTVGVALFAIDLEGCVRTWNVGAERLFGWRAEDIVGGPAAVLWTEADRAAGADLAELRRVAATGEAEAVRYHPRRDGSLVWVVCHTSAVYESGPDGEPGGGRLVGYAKIARDGTDEQQARDALRVSEDDLRASETQRRADETRLGRLHDRLGTERAEVRRLADALADAVTDEQRRIASILHDDLQQLLVGARLRLHVLAMKADDRLQTDLAETSQILADALTTTRTLTSRIVPPDVVSARLDASFEWLAGNRGDTHGLQVDLDFDCPDDGPDAPLAGHERLLLFQATRELLFNVVKHAGTDRARVACRATPRVVTITVEDDGVGIDAGASAGYGIADVRRRLAAAGGTLTTQRKDDGGTCAVVRLLRTPIPAGTPDPADAPGTANEANPDGPSTLSPPNL